jgi:hypothetical protein
MHGHRGTRGQNGDNPGARAPGSLRAGTDTDELLHRFARELRIGAFENSPDRVFRARAILWQLTVARLRQSNPEFLAANGID